ncbi:hypothetical protein ERX46_10495 [Brumimicrobium glaciale]|uniref:Outer membrane protein beta-barrel domain-containing protein n=1 Tax=Brumimicrobium glaciale TaxID=200475 RepID=A0A4Q4KJE2_9FLAO|nr:hypothetical protein [Brumimicrobium glaciale]RYM33362.1 hypothetical protein ERX46_10495 [Brumimicrobium glaciale]
MSEENKNIDQLFSDAAHTESAPQYDSAYWAEMNSMLNAKDSKKRAFIFWALGGSAAFAVLFLSLFTLNMDNSIEKERYVREEMNLNIYNENLLANRISTVERDENSNQTSQGATNEIENAELSLANSNNTKRNQINSNLESQNNVGENQNTSRINKNQIKNNSFKNNSNLAVIGSNKSHSSDSRIKNNQVNGNSEASVKANNSSNINTEISNSRKANAKKGHDIILNLPFTRAYTLTQNAKNDIALSDSEIKERPKYSLYTKMSGGLMENYKTSRPYESGLFDLSLNLEVDMNNVLFRTGLGTQLTSNADLIVSQRKEINDIIVVKLQKDLSYQSLIDIYIPLELGYQLNNTSFGVGAQVNYLLTTSMELNNYENKLLVNTEKQFGNRDGLNSFSTQGYIWIEQRFSPMISLGLKTGTNISGRIKDGAYFNESATTNPIYGQLSLKVNLIK